MTPPSSPPESARPDLVVLSHLRWSWVWQRPQHLISRFAEHRTTWFIEEPIAADVAEPEMTWRRDGNVVVGCLCVPGPARHVGFDAPEADALRWIVRRAMQAPAPLVWLYTPLALPIARALHPELLVYDVMDDLASFRGASAKLRAAQLDALGTADLVFTGGRSLHSGVLRHRQSHAHKFASGVEPEHFASARGLRRPSTRPVAGYVGVIDERLDLALLGTLADELPDWDLHVVGPVAKIDPADLPQRPNLSYPGPAEYKDLPAVLGRFDVALMPFALNEATRSISPTKTLEYFAAGLPIVSTKVPDVVADFSDVVLLADDVTSFAQQCRAARRVPEALEWQRRIDRIVERHTWDSIATQMAALVEKRRDELAVATSPTERDVAGAAR